MKRKKCKHEGGLGWWGCLQRGIFPDCNLEPKTLGSMAQVEEYWLNPIK